MRTLTGPRSAHDRRLLEERVRALRDSPTPSEQVLWSALGGRQLGVTFRRQVLIGRYIVDFVAPATRLIVEIYGSFHAQRARTDARRDAALVSAGYRVLRLEAQLVLRAVARRDAHSRRAVSAPYATTSPCRAQRASARAALGEVAQPQASRRRATRQRRFA